MVWRDRLPSIMANRERARTVRALTRLLGLSVCSLAFSLVHANDVVRGTELYMSECSKCHGVMEAQGNATHSPRVRALRHVAFFDQSVYQICEFERTSGSCQASPNTLVFALPYGPSLEGVYGREAGTFTDFEFSKAFMAALAGTIWDERTLDEYITDSQVRAPGARMFYRQTDSEARRLIIEFLKSRR